MIRNPYREFEKALGYRFRRKRHLETAFTHRSYSYESAEAALDNQRLEFLGDAALGLIAAHHLFETHPDFQEGDLTRLRSRITSARALSAIAARLQLGARLLLGKGEEMSGGKHRNSNLADALEAVIGAAYIDGGMKAVQKIFRKHFLSLLEEPAHGWADNPKGALQERLQQMGHGLPRYVTLHEAGPAHARHYTIAVKLGDRVIGTGTGANKREAEQDAARDAMQNESLV